MATTTTDRPQSPSGPSAISAALAQVTARLRLARWVRHAARGALAGVGISFIAVILAHFDLLPDWLPLEAVLPGAILLGIAGGTVTTFLRPIAPMDAARLAEARLGLKERLSSALEFERAPQGTVSADVATLMRLQQEDAAVHARGLKAVEAVPLRWPWEAKAAAAGLAVLALALFIPNLPVFLPPGVLVERQIVHKTGDKLQKTARLIQRQAEGQHLEGTRRAAINMQRLGKRLASGKMDKKQAMVQISKMTQQMKADQLKRAQANSSAGAGSKSLAQAGQQLAQALSGASASGTGSKAAGAGQKSGGGNKAGQKPGQNGGAGGKNGAGDQFHGFTVPGASKNKPAHPGQTPPGVPPTPEMKKAAQAMQQNDSQGLSEQLRQMANRTESGKLAPAEQQQAAKDLQNLADALKNTPMPETQKHTQAAADAMKRGDKQAAASEMRKAADAAEREAHEQADQDAMQDAQQSVEGAENEMAGANSAGDVQDDSGQGQGQGNGKGKGKGQGQGQGAGAGEGAGQGLANSGGKHGSGKGNGGSGGGGMSGGKPGDTGEGSSPLKHLGKMDPSKSSKYAKLYFGKPQNAGPSKTGPMRKVGSNPNASPGQTTSKVPYYNYVAPAQKSAESTMDKEDIPPAYRSDVRRYFNSLNPPSPSGSGH